MILPMDPSGAISLAKDLFTTLIFIIRLARRDTKEMHEWVDAVAALEFYLVRAEDTLTVVQDWEPVMHSIDSFAGQAVARQADKVRLHERVNELHSHIESIQKLFKESRLDFDNTTRWDLIYLRLNVFAKERKVMPLEEMRVRLARLVKHLDCAMTSVRDAFFRLRDSPIPFPNDPTERFRSVAADVKQAFNESPFCLQLHPTGHLADELLELMSSQSALSELRAVLTICGRDWVDRQLRAAENADIDGLERVEKSHRNLVSRLYQVLDEWKSSFPDLTNEVEQEAQEAKRNLMEWYVTSCRRYLALTVAIGGRVSEGKSSLLNAILGRTILPTDSELDRYSFLMGRYLMYCRGGRNGSTLLHPPCRKTRYPRTYAPIFGALHPRIKAISKVRTRGRPLREGGGAQDIDYQEVRSYRQQTFRYLLHHS